MPEAFVTPETVVIVELPAPWASVTDWPASGWPKASLAVTVRVVAELPLAVTEAGVGGGVGGGRPWGVTGGGGGETVELAASTARGVKLTAGVWVRVTGSVVSVAV